MSIDFRTTTQPVEKNDWGESQTTTAPISDELIQLLEMHGLKLPSPEAMQQMIQKIEQFYRVKWQDVPDLATIIENASLDDDMRMQRAEELFSGSVTSDQQSAILEAHRLFPDTMVFSLSAEQIAAKKAILLQAWLSDTQAKLLLDHGICGAGSFLTIIVILVVFAWGFMAGVQRKWDRIKVLAQGNAEMGIQELIESLRDNTAATWMNVDSIKSAYRLDDVQLESNDIPGNFSYLEQAKFDVQVQYRLTYGYSFPQDFEWRNFGEGKNEKGDREIVIKNATFPSIKAYHRLDGTAAQKKGQRLEGRTIDAEEQTVWLNLAKDEADETLQNEEFPTSQYTAAREQAIKSATALLWYFSTQASLLWIPWYESILITYTHSLPDNSRMIVVTVRVNADWSSTVLEMQEHWGESIE